MSVIEPTCPWPGVKPQFYEDARHFNLAALAELRADEPKCLGRYERRPGFDGWSVIEHSLKDAVREAYKQAAPEAPTCPYYDELAARLGRYPLGIDVGDEARQTFMEVSLPGGVEAPVLITGLLRRMSLARDLFDIDINPKQLAQNSVGLLREPLAHPQQWAKAFMFTLVETEDILGRGTLLAFRHTSFLPPRLLKKYIKVSNEPNVRLEWAVPLSEFELMCSSIAVISRSLGSESHPTETNITHYTKGTTLGDIQVDEPTIGCPGKPMALYLYKRAIMLADERGLWDVPAL